MDLGAPLRDVTPGVRGALLQTLVRLQQPVTRRQLAAAAGVAPGHASAVIDSLISTGLVNETAAGRSSMVSLNRHHISAAPVIALAGLRGEFIARLRERLTHWDDLAGAWLFGSVARGDADENSDIDLLLLANDLGSIDLHVRLSRLHTDARAWTGNDLQIVEHTPASWDQLRSARNPLVEQVRRDGIALIASDSSLLGRS